MTAFQQQRVSRGLSRKAMAERMGVHPSSVAVWDTGRSRPRDEKIPQLAELMGMEARSLMRLIERQTAEWRARRDHARHSNGGGWRTRE